MNGAWSARARRSSSQGLQGGGQEMAITERSMIPLLDNQSDVWMGNPHALFAGYVVHRPIHPLRYAGRRSLR
jgi:hypothetical protein